MKESVKTQLTYGLDALPPFGILIVLALQHVLVAIVDLAIPVLVVRTMGGSPAQITWMVQMTIVAIALGTLLQIQKRKIGSGYLIPHSATSIFLAPSILAVQSGGVAMVAGMTAVSGVFQIGLAKLTQRMRRFIPVHFSGVILGVNGFVVVHAAIPCLLSFHCVSGKINWRMAMVGLATLSVMAGILLKSHGRLRLFGAGICLIFGNLLYALFGADGNQMVAAVQSVPLLALPKWQHPGFDVDAALIVPFLIAALAVAMKGSGLIAKGDQINRNSASINRRQRLSKGRLADGASIFISGLLGGFGTSMSAANVGLSISSGATSRRVGYGVAAIFLLLTFFPKLATTLSFMPQPVMGATMICIGVHLLCVGFQLIRTSSSNKSKILTAGLPLLVGLWIEFSPPTIRASPPWIMTLLTSSISVSVLLVFGLHYFTAGSRMIGAALRFYYSKAKRLFSPRYLERGLSVRKATDMRTVRTPTKGNTSRSVLFLNTNA